MVTLENWRERMSEDLQPGSERLQETLDRLMVDL